MKAQNHVPNQEVRTRRQKLFLNLNEHLQIFFELDQNKQTNKQHLSSLS